MLYQKISDSFGHIEYYDKDHIYKDRNTGKILTSVTTKIKEYEQEFDEDYWADFKSFEKGVSKQQILSLWHMQRVYGNTKGSIIHEYLENKMQRKEFHVEVPEFIYKPAINKCYLLAEMFLQQHRETYYNEYNELIVGNKNIAGQIDNLSILRENNKRVLIDFKTDKEIDFENVHQSFLRPFNNLDQCAFNKYTIQTNTYKYLFEEGTKESIDQIKIVWINEDNSEPIWFDVKDLNTVKHLIE